MIKVWRKLFAYTVIGCLVVGVGYSLRHQVPATLKEPLGLGSNIAEIRANQTPRLTAALSEIGLDFGAPVFLRVFKETSELELWVANGETYSLFKTYPICNYSGQLGPKLKEGDHQSPEGIYLVGAGALNPNSSFHLSFNLGFPNAYDRFKGRTGSFLMIHGNCVSMGCYAMTDQAIEEIYVLVEAALTLGQAAVPVHAFPFRMTQERMYQTRQNQWASFWGNLKPIYDAFENNRQVPTVFAKGGRYQM